MIQCGVRSVVLSVPLAFSACSLHTLDYLEAGKRAPSAGGGGSLAAAGSESSSGGSNAGSAPAQGGGRGGGDSAGADAGEGGYPGAAGAPPGADCSNGQTNLGESDIDCGGRNCEPCEAGKQCVMGADCESGICSNQVCQAASCTDQAVNGGEADLNCGGPCAACAPGLQCSANSDCASDRCTEGICQSASCEDGVLQDGCPLLADNTPYEMSPAQALAKCVDDAAHSVAEGNGMILWPCKPELQQAFWTVAQPGGYFAFRSALSGKCLQVRGASTSHGAIIEQSTCDYAPEQLWAPIRIDSTLMQLTNKLSGLALDVAGSSVTATGQAIVQGKVDGGIDTHWRLQRRTAGTNLALSPFADRSLRIWHSRSKVTIGSDTSASSQWRVMPGLADARYVSFRSSDEPGRYLRYSDSRLWNDLNDGSAQFARESTFDLADPLLGDDSQTKSLRAFDDPTRFLERDGDLVLMPVATEAMPEAVTWWIRPG